MQSLQLFAAICALLVGCGALLPSLACLAPHRPLPRGKSLPHRLPGLKFLRIFFVNGFKLLNSRCRRDSEPPSVEAPRLPTHRRGSPGYARFFFHPFPSPKFPILTHWGVLREGLIGSPPGGGPPTLLRFAGWKIGWSILTSGLPHLATAATFYVSPNGADSATCGDASAPCRSIRYAAGTRAPPLGTAGTVIQLLPGVYSEKNLSCFEKDMIIRGDPANPTAYAVQGDYTWPVFYWYYASIIFNYTTCHIEGLTLKRGEADPALGKGGCVHLQGVTGVSMSDVHFTECKATVGAAEGGGMYIKRAGPILRRLQFYNNYAGIKGGGLYLCTSAKPKVYDSILRDNYIQNGALYGLQSGGQGGNLAPENDSQGEFYNCSIYNGTATFGGGVGDGTKSAAKFFNCTIFKNKAVQGGGYRAAAFSNATFTGCKIYDNTAATSSGGVEIVSDATPTFINTEIRDNVAPEAGGFKHSGLQKVTITNCTISRNVATGLCGGFFVANTIDITDTIIRDNRAGTFGGGVYMLAPENRSIFSNVQIINNKATSGGGGLSIDAQHMKQFNFSSLVVERNEASTGGGLYVTGLAVVEVADSVFRNNKAASGAGLYTGLNSKLSLQSVTIVNNTARVSGGGAMAVQTSQLIVEDTIFNKNNAGSNGGAIFVNDLAFLMVEGGSVEANHARYGAGFYFASEATECPDLQSTTFQSNKADVSGSTIYFTGLAAAESCNGTFACTDCTLEKNNIATYHGNLGNVSSGPYLLVIQNEMPTSIKPGEPFNVDFKVMDVFGQQMSGPTDLTVSLMQKDENGRDAILATVDPSKTGTVTFSFARFTARPMSEIAASFVTNSLNDTLLPSVRVSLKACGAGEYEYHEGDNYLCLTDSRISPQGVIVISVLTAFAIAVCIGVIIFLVIYRDNHVVRAANFLFCILISVAAIVALSGNFFWFNTVACSARYWLPGVGLITLFSALFIKFFNLFLTFRAANQLNMKKATITNQQLFTHLSVLVVPAVVLLIVWTAAATPIPRRVFDTTTTFTVSDDCILGEGGLISLAVLVAWLGVVLVIGAVIAYLGRNIPASFNESSYIGFAIYNAVIFISLAIILIAVTNTTVGATWVVCIFVFFIVMVTMVLIFGPKILYIQRRGFFKEEVEKEIANLEFELKNKKRQLVQIENSSKSGTTTGTRVTRSIYDMSRSSDGPKTNTGTEERVNDTD